MSQVGSQAKEHLDAVKSRAAEDVRNLGEEAKAKAGEVTEKAKSFASEQKDLAAGQISGVASALDKVANELEGTEQQTIARYARDISRSLSDFGRQIENRDVDDLMGAAQDFGRKQPVAFLGAAALAGFVASRFAAASAHRRSTAQSQPQSSTVQPVETPSYSNNTYKPESAGSTTTGNGYSGQTGGV
ncbi:hypothetical protein VW35_19540 [Devosia soli]|uniref:Nutrient deprivation-induced protein n=1 Tax=Devosia soli TaxID=361041 RepID=A0A0F5L1M5_9HYPH|nr:hypothetical protein VW35_19540 [Devosia soli]